MYYANKTQKLAAEILDKHIATGRISQAYFFTGEELSFDPETDLSPKAQLVIDFAVRLVGGLADEANRKRRILSDKHPDVLRLGTEEDLTSVKVESMRRMLEWTALKPFEGERRIGIIHRAEKLTEESANAFLKTLEEAPGNMVFCLLAPSRELVLETIRSRCFEVRFPEAAGWNPAATAALPPFREMLENYSDLPKPELKTALDTLLQNIRARIDTASASSVKAAAAYLKAFEAVRETKAALEMNANAKLAVTNMIMKLRHVFPDQRGIA